MKIKQLNIILLILSFLLSGCATLQPRVVTPQIHNKTGIDPFSVTQFPLVSPTINKCLQGKVDEIIAGNEATTIWYTITNIVGLSSVRLPHTYPVKIKIVEKGFCYGFFDVIQN